MPSWSWQTWVKNLWRIGIPIVAVLLAWYASWSNCSAIENTAARAQCSGDSGAQVFGMVLGFLLVVWVVLGFIVLVAIAVVERRRS